MNSSELAQKIRKLIDEATLAAGLSERDACQVGSEACAEAAEGYDMRLDEIMNEEEEDWDQGDMDD